MSKVPSSEYELLYQFEIVFRDGEHKTQAASRDYQKVWENVIDNPPPDGVTPVLVYRMNGETCAAVAGLDDLIEHEEAAMEIARLAAENDALRECVRAADVFAASATRALDELRIGGLTDLEFFQLEEAGQLYLAARAKVTP